MAASYTKLFSSLVTSTVWMEDNETRILWITMLALADKNGEVQGSIPGLARIAGISIEGCRASLAKFLSPDKDSRTKEDEGRRVIEIEGGWHLLNYSKYRRMASKEDQVEKASERTRRWRERKRLSTDGDASSTHVHDISTEAEAEEEADSEAEAVKESEMKESESTPKGAPKPKEPSNGRSTRGTRLPTGWRASEALRTFATGIGLSPDDIEAGFTDYWGAVPGAKGLKLDWDATWRIWCRNQAGRAGRSPQGVRSAGSEAGAFARAGHRLARD